MKHYGDITKISGYEVPEVDIICGGSPCQDLSVAGKRAGLAGERSGLFMDQIRIIKEMREKEKQSGKTNDAIRPRYMVWENVPGAFSSNKGEDFRAVLEETAKVVDKDAVIPEPEKGKWTPAGCIVGDGWSIAWRLHDAQFWGVPQRRKRIALVADFGGQSAPEILFERNGMSGDIETCGQKGQGTSDDAKGCVDKTGLFGITEENEQQIEDFISAVNSEAKHQQDLLQSDLGIARTLAPGTHASGPHLTKTLVTSVAENKLYDVRISSDGTKNWRAHCYETEISRALDTGGENPDSNHGGVAVVYGISPYESNSMKSNNPHSGVYVADTARTLDLNGGSPACNQGGMAVVYNGDSITSPINASNPQPGDPCHTLSNDNRNYVVFGFNRGNGSGIPAMEEKQPTLQAAAGESGNNQPLVCQPVYATQACGDRDKPSQSFIEEKAYTIPSNPMSDRGQAVCQPILLESNQDHATIQTDGISTALPASMGMGGGYVPMITDDVYCLQGNGIDRADTAGCNGKGWRENESYTLNTIDRPAVCYRKQGHPQNAEQGQGWEKTDVNDTLNIFDNSEGRTPTLITQSAFENHSQDTRYRPLGEVCSSVSATYGMGGNNQPFVVKQVYDASRRHNYEPFGDVCETVQAHYGTGGGNVPMVVDGEQTAYGIDQQGGKGGANYTVNVAPTMAADSHGTPHGVAYGIDCYNQSQSEEQTMGITSAATDPNHIPCTYQKVTGTIDCCISKGTSNQLANNDMFVANSIVRRLTPLECERLQGYPDYWTDIGEWIDSKGKKHKDADSPRYKALGNSIALPFWQWMAYRMCSYMKEPTMASLFDGIGGFPLVFSRAGCKPIWASEIEEFPIAVTKIRFPEEQENG